MKPTFALDHSEFEFADKLQHEFEKEHYSILIPVSRQQKYFDLAILRLDDRLVKTFQVKSSRSYVTSRSDSRRFGIIMHGWFNPIKLDPKLDFLALMIYFPSAPNSQTWKRTSWDVTTIVMTPEKAKSYNMDYAKFYIGITESDDLVVCRSITPVTSLKASLFEHWLPLLKGTF